MEDSELKDNSSIEIMNYLIKKLESSYKYVLKYKPLIDSLDTSDTFFTLRKDLISLFNDLDENLKQGIFAIKALTNQNKQILQEMKIKDIENKNTIERLNNIIEENKNLKSQIIRIKGNNINEKFEEDDIKDINKEDIIEDNIEEKKEEINDNVIIENNYRIKDKKEENIKKNKYELEQLSNVKNIMNNMKRNKMKIKMAIDQHFTNNQEQDMNDN